MSQLSDVLDYELIGDDLQAVIVTLDPGETVIAEAGAMMFMEQGIEMNTTLDPNKQGGGMFGKLFAGARRVLSGDTFFITTFANGTNSRRSVAFSSPRGRNWISTFANAECCSYQKCSTCFAFVRYGRPIVSARSSSSFAVR